MTAFASQLRRLRKEKSLTQEQLATLLHVTRQTISNWENDRAQPDYEMLSAIASVFEVPLSVLLGEEAAPEATPDEAACEPEIQAAPPSALDGGMKETPLASPRIPGPRRFVAIVFAAVAVVVLFAAIKLRTRPVSVPFSLEYFTTEAQILEGASHLHIYTRGNSSRYVQARPEATPRWEFRFFLQETGGIGLHIDMLTTVLFTKNGMQYVDAKSDAQLKDSIGHPDISPSEMRMYIFNTPAEPDITGVGLEVRATDEAGNALVFPFYQPLEYAPR